MTGHPQRLSRSFVERVKEPGRYGDGRGGFGLTLIVRPRASGGVRKTWAQRLTIDGMPVDIGLGPYPVVTLGEARDAALDNRRAVWQGRDPKRKKDTRVPTFEEAAEKVIKAHQDSWKAGSQLPSRWRQMFRDYAKPIARKRIDAISSADVLSILLPIWNTRRATARQLKQRIGKVMQWAMAEGLRSDNPAGEAIKGGLPRNGKPTQNHRALHYSKMGAAVEAIRTQTYASRSASLALEFLILTATRGGEVRGARWSEIDMDEWTWLIPSTRMKNGKEHRIPLSSGAMLVLMLADEIRDGSGLVFPSTYQGKQLSQRTLGRLLINARLDCVPHGMRSSFRDWAAECSDVPREIAEHALAHIEGSASELAYRRTDYFERRRALMQGWSDYLMYPPAEFFGERELEPHRPQLVLVNEVTDEGVWVSEVGRRVRDDERDSLGS